MKKIIITLVFCVTPLPTLAADYQSKINGLKGTWLLSHSNTTDKITLDGDAVLANAKDGSYKASGTLFLNSKGGSEAFLCTSSPTIQSSLNVDFLCNSGGVNPHYYAINFSENSITTGYYATAGTGIEAFLILMKKTYPISGYRITSDGTIPIQSPKAPTSNQIFCVFNWAESIYQQIFPVSNGDFLSFPPYTYRFYQSTNYYLAVSSTDNHVYYMSGQDNIMHDVGDISGFFQESGCQ